MKISELSKWLHFPFTKAFANFRTATAISVSLDKSSKIFNADGLKPINRSLSKVPNSIGSLS